jgi:DNA helicase-2/ATP-dependent DNA helicase PcrA
LLSNPKDDLAFLRVVNVPPRHVGKTTLERLAARARELDIPLLAMAREGANVAGLKDRAARGLRDFVMLLDELSALREHPAEEVLRRLLTLSGYHAYLEADAKGGGEDRLANVDELVSAARQFDREHPGSTVLDFVQEVSLASAVDRWKDGAGAVALMTLHAAKGLEFPVVFVVGLEQGILPHSRSNDSDSELEEERRLLFVGMTRARKELHLSHCRVREFRGQRTAAIPSLFLAELPEEGIEARDRSGYGGSAMPARRPPALRPSWPAAGGFRLTTAAALEGEPAPSAPAAGLDEFRPGVRVMHPEYGLGRIVAIDGAGPNRKGRVAFAVGGERTFVLARSPLRPVGGR